jgi:hypothetical protein
MRFLLDCFCGYWYTIDREGFSKALTYRIGFSWFNELHEQARFVHSWFNENPETSTLSGLVQGTRGYA